MSQLIDKSAKRLLRYLLAGSFFMVLGALFYATKTESLEYCKTAFDSEIYTAVE
jgi:hypothetical protein